MGFEVKIIADSVSQAGKRLTTLTATYPRFVHCFDDATEVLCEIDGRRDFYPFSILTKDHQVAAYHPQADSIHFEQPIDVVHEHYDGEMVCLDSHAYLSFCVTPHHRMFVGSRKSWGDQWEVVLASELHEATQKRFRTAGVVCDGCYLGEPLSEFIGFFVGDGHLPKHGHQAMFNLKKARKKEYVRELLDALSVEYSCVTYDDGVTRFTFDRFPLLEACYSEDGQKRIPNVIMNATNSDMHAFMYGLWFSDGSTDKGEIKSFNTSSEGVAKSLGALAAMCGDSVNVRGPYGGDERRLGIYKLTRVINNQPILRKDKTPVRNIQYSGMVHCATVSTGLLVVRHNGIVHVSGNSEVMTHRDRERNAASSRAIPWAKMKQMIITEPVVPIAWGMEQSGMQAAGEIPERMRPLAERLWLEARDWALHYADALANIGQTFADRYPSQAEPGDEKIRVHKSLPNRITEPWMWITVVMTATEWENFYRLRCHPDAEIHFQKIANMIREARAASTPVLLKDGDWHLPFIQEDEKADSSLDIEVLKQASVARCARVSYLTHEGVRSIAKDLDTFVRLANGSGFGHWSPHGHVAKAMAEADHRSGPFVGWSQFRKAFANENVPG